MKQSFIFLLAFCASNCLGQNVNIPDPILKEYLVERFAAAADTESGFELKVDANGDGQIQLSEAEAIVALRIRNQDFTNPEGLQFFKNLEYLDINGNEVQSMDLSNLTKLETLDLGGNNFSQVNLSFLANLKLLNISGNELSTIDLSNNILLEELQISANNFVSLNISNLPNLVELDPLPNEELKNLTISNNEKLNEIKLNLSFGQFHEFDNLVISNNASLESIATDQINTAILDISNCPFISINLLALTNMTNFKCTGELIKYQGTTGLVLPEAIRNVNVENNSISSLLFTEWSVDNYNFDTDGGLQLQIRNAGKSQLQIYDSPSVTSITEIGNPDDKFTGLDLVNLPNLETLVLQRQNFSTVELIDFPKLETLKIGAEDIYLENLGIKSYDTDYTQADVRLFATNKLTFKSCSKILGMEFKEVFLNELNIIDIPAGTELEVVDGTYGTINLISNYFNTAALYSQGNSDLNIETLNISESEFDELDVIINKGMDEVNINSSKITNIIVDVNEPCSLTIFDCPTTEKLKIKGPFNLFNVSRMPELVEYECDFFSNPSLLEFHDFPKLEVFKIINADPFDITTKVEYSGLPLLRDLECSFNRINESGEHLVNFEDEYKMEDLFLLGQSLGDVGFSKNHIRFCNMPSLKNFNHYYFNDTLNLDLSSCPKIENFIIPRLCDTLNLSNGTNSANTFGSNLSLNVICVDDEAELAQIQESSINLFDVEFVFGCDRACMITSNTTNNIIDSKFEIYPNPTSNFALIKSSEAFKEITIRDLTGQLIAIKSFNTAVNEFELKQLNFADGIYFISILINERLVTKKLVVTN